MLRRQAGRPICERERPVGTIGIDADGEEEANPGHSKPTPTGGLRKPQTPVNILSFYAEQSNASDEAGGREKTAMSSSESASLTDALWPTGLASHQVI